MAAAAEQSSEQMFFAELLRSPNSILVVDYDQTIWLFSATECGSSIPESLRAITATGKTRVIVMSDLRAMQVASLLQMSPTPEIWGARGLERRAPSGRCAIIDTSSQAEQALAALDLSLEAEGLGELTEVHPGAIVLRWNSLSPRVAEEVRERTTEAWSAVRSEWLTVREFEAGIEFRVCSWNKGQAIAHLLRETGLHTPLAYLGDEKSDLDVFRMLKYKGLCVLVRPRFVPTLADVWLRSKEDVLRFLKDWLTACSDNLAAV